jgi:hypothetical protein
MIPDIFVILLYALGASSSGIWAYASHPSSFTVSKEKLEGLNNDVTHIDENDFIFSKSSSDVGESSSGTSSVSNARRRLVAGDAVAFNNPTGAESAHLLTFILRLVSDIPSICVN